MSRIWTNGLGKFPQGVGNQCLKAVCFWQCFSLEGWWSWLQLGVRSNAAIFRNDLVGRTLQSFMAKILSDSYAICGWHRSIRLDITLPERSFRPIFIKCLNCCCRYNIPAPKSSDYQFVHLQWQEANCQYNFENSWLIEKNQSWGNPPDLWEIIRLEDIASRKYHFRRNLNFITNLTLSKPLILSGPQSTSHTACNANILKPLIKKVMEIKCHIVEKINWNWACRSIV